MLFQTDFAYGRKQQPTDYISGGVCVAIFEHTFTEDFTAAEDILELGMLPGGARPVRATLIGEGLATTTADVGTMDGTAGENDADRELTTDLLFDGESVADAEAEATMAECLAIEPTSNHRGIGLTLDTNVSAGTDKVTLVLEYAF